MTDGAHLTEKPKNRVEVLALQLDAAFQTVSGLVDGLDEHRVFEFKYGTKLLESLRTLQNGVKVAADHEDPDAQLGRLLDHWLYWYAKQGYLELANSVNSAYGYALGRVIAQAEARACHTVFEQVYAFTQYGVFEVRSLERRP